MLDSRKIQASDRVSVSEAHRVGFIQRGGEAIDESVRVIFGWETALYGSRGSRQIHLQLSEMSKPDVAVETLLGGDVRDGSEWVFVHHFVYPLGFSTVVMEEIAAERGHCDYDSYSRAGVCICQGLGRWVNA